MNEPFDFDTWAKLAQDDPAEFERKRGELLGGLLERMAERTKDPVLVQRLRGLQFRIDMERERAKTPLKSTMAVYNMMWDTFVDMKNRLEELTEMSKALRDGEPMPVASAPTESTAATVLPFRRDGDQ